MLIKSIPEDFIVEEIPIEFSDKGDYSIYKLTKKDFNTESAVEHICNKFNIPRKNIKYAGSKDRHALTTQFISIFKDKGNLKIDTDNIKLGFISFHNEPLSLGSLKGNKFIIKIRDLSEEELNNFKTRFSDDYVFPNYFDDQRFSEYNFDIGLSILKRDFENACKLAKIEVKNNDYVNALNKIPKKTLLFYIHSVQALIFNKELSEKIKGVGKYYLKEYSKGELAFLEDKNYQSLNIKLVGFDVDSGLLKEFGLTSRDFIIKQFPELSVEGIERECFVKTELTYTQDQEGMTLEFILPKGSYATMMIKSLF